MQSQSLLQLNSVTWPAWSLPVNEYEITSFMRMVFVLTNRHPG